MGVSRKKFPVTPAGIDPGTVRLVTQWYYVFILSSIFHTGYSSIF